MREDWRLAVALRLLFSARVSIRNSRLISFTGLISIGGLVLAVAVLVTVLSVMNGFERELRERVLNVLPQGTLYIQQDIPQDAARLSGDSSTDWRGLVAEFLTHPEVTGAAPLVEGKGLIVHAGELVGVNFRGLVPEYEQTVSILHQFFVSGSMQALASHPFGVVMGEELAHRLGVELGNKITLVLPQVNYTLAGPSFTTKSLHLVGVFRVGADLDKHQIFVQLPAAMRLKRQTDIDGIVIQSTDLFNVHSIMQELVVASSHKYLYPVSWMRHYGNLYEAIQTQKSTLFLLLIILVAVAAFNLVSNLMLTLDDNRANIAILRTLGAAPAEIQLIFLLHGLAVGLIGVLLGVLIGLLLSLSLGYIYTYLSELFSLNLMSEYFIRYLPTDIIWGDILYISGLSLMICLIATIYPAAKAAAVAPVKALQHAI